MAFSISNFSRAHRLVINLIGTTGSGKGTQGEMLAKRYGIPHLSLGDIYREAMGASTDLGKIITYQAGLDATYTTNEVCLGILAMRLSQPDCQYGFILDGFPRTEAQGDVLTTVVLSPKDLHIPIFLDVPDEVIESRLEKRWYCSPCNKQIREHDPIDKEGQCPQCTGPLEKRVDDKDKEKVAKKLRVFSHFKEGILTSVSKRDSIHTIPYRAEEGPHTVFKQIQTIVDRSIECDASPGKKWFTSKQTVLVAVSLIAFSFLAVRVRR